MNKKVSLTPAVFHLSEEVNSIANSYSENPIVPRGPGLKPVLDRVRSKLSLSLGGEGIYEAIVYTSSGSGAIAAALGSFVDEKGILIVSNGAYGERQARYAKQLGLRFVHYRLEYGVRPDLAEIESLIDKNQLGAIGIVHGCTSTCSLNPIEEVGELAKKKGVKLIVDGIASIFVEEFELEKCGVDVLIGSVNKGLHSNPDLSFLLVRRNLLNELEEEGSKIPYFDALENWKCQKEGSHPYTINVRALLEVDQALDLFMRQGGILGRVRTYRDRLKILRAGYEKLSLRVFQKEGMPLQNIGTALYLPLGVKYEELADFLSETENEEGEVFEIYSAQGKLSEGVFRVFNMGEYSLDTYQRFIAALEKAIHVLQQ